MVPKKRIVSLCSKTKDYCFLTIRKVYHQFFFQQMILPAVMIKPYCLKLFFEKDVCLNYRPIFQEQTIVFILAAIKPNQAKFFWLRSNGLRNFKQIKLKTAEIMKFHFYCLVALRF